MSRFFRRLPVDKPVVRNNYSFQVIGHADGADPLDPEELSWAKTMKGDEDVEDGKPGFLRSQGTNEASMASLDSKTEPVDPALIRLRVERQTLRRLPRTGAIVFTIRVYMTPLEELAKEPDIPGRMASAIRSWPEDVARYDAYIVEIYGLLNNFLTGTKRVQCLKVCWDIWMHAMLNKLKERQRVLDLVDNAPELRKYKLRDLYEIQCVEIQCMSVSPLRIGYIPSVRRLPRYQVREIYGLRCTETECDLHAY